MEGQALRSFVIDLLDDEAGINKTAWQELAEALADEGNDDIVRAVKTQDGRFYLPAPTAEKLRQVDWEDNEDEDDEEEDDRPHPDSDPADRLVAVSAGCGRAYRH